MKEENFIFPEKSFVSGNKITIATYLIYLKIIKVLIRSETKEINKIAKSLPIKMTRTYSLLKEMQNFGFLRRDPLSLKYSFMLFEIIDLCLADLQFSLKDQENMKTAISENIELIINSEFKLQDNFNLRDKIPIKPEIILFTLLSPINNHFNRERVDMILRAYNVKLLSEMEDYLKSEQVGQFNLKFKNLENKWNYFIGLEKFFIFYDYLTGKSIKLLY